MLNIITRLIGLNQHIATVGVTLERESMLVDSDIPDLMLLGGLSKCL